MRVAIIHPQLDLLRGAERLVICLAQGLAEKGYEVTIFANCFSRELWGKESSFAVKMLKDLNEKLLPLSWMVTSCDLKKQLASFDVVNFQGFPSSIWIHLAGKLGDLPPAVWYCHEPPRFLHYNLMNEHLAVRSAFRRGEEERSRLRGLAEKALAWTDKRIVKNFPLILANSNYTAQMIEKVYGRNSEVCYPGIVFPPAEKKSDGECLFSVAQLYTLKNLHTVIESLPLVLTRIGEGLRYKIVGQGPAESYLKGLVKRLGLEKVVEFLGFVREDDLWDYYQSARINIYPCLDEPFGRVILEGARFSLPAIVANHGGPAEIIIHGKTGLQVDALDKEAWAEAILALWTEPERCRKMGEEAYRRLCQEFTAEKFVDRFEKFMLRHLKG